MVRAAAAAAADYHACPEILVLSVVLKGSCSGVRPTLCSCPHNSAYVQLAFLVLMLMSWQHILMYWIMSAKCSHVHAGWSRQGYWTRSMLKDSA